MTRTYQQLKLSLYEANLSASGKDVIRHKEKYIDPHVNSGQFVFELNSEWSRLSPGSKVAITNTFYKKFRGVDTLHANIVDEQGNHYEIPVNKLNKPGTKIENEGHKYENKVINTLKTYGLMPKETKGAGSSAGTDFILQAKTVKANGRVVEENKVYLGETKLNSTTAAFGQLTLSYTPDKKWHVDSKSSAIRPLFEQALKDAGIIKYLNKHHALGPTEMERTASGRIKNVVLYIDSLYPAVEYLRDHHVDIIQIGGGSGAYSIGPDKTKFGFPNLETIDGKGMFIVREKNHGKIMVQFQPHTKAGLPKSDKNLDDEETVKALAKHLGTL